MKKAPRRLNLTKETLAQLETAAGQATATGELTASTCSCVSCRPEACMATTTIAV